MWVPCRPLAFGRSSSWLFHLHDLRHACASLGLAASMPAKVISERLGHASVGITLDTYSHVLPGLQEEAAATIPALFAQE